MHEKCSVEKGECDQFCNEAEWNYKYFLWHPNSGCFIYRHEIDEEEFSNFTDSRAITIFLKIWGPSV